MGKKRSDVEKLVAIEEGKFFGKLFTYRASSDGLVHYLNTYDIVFSNKEGFFRFVNVQTYPFTCYNALYERISKDGYLRVIDGWDALPNTIIRECFDKED